MSTEQTPNCPKCNSQFSYLDGSAWVCPQCFHEWTIKKNPIKDDTDSESKLVKDSGGKILKDGDSVSIIKDLKVKGSTSSIKIGTKIKNIKLIEEYDGHNIACKIDGFGAMDIKSEFVKKLS